MSRSSCAPAPPFGGAGDPLRAVETAAFEAVETAANWFAWVSGTDPGPGARTAADGGAAPPGGGAPARPAPGDQGTTAAADAAPAPADGKPKAVSSAAGALQRVKSFNSSPHADAWRSLPQKMGPVAMVRSGWRSVKPEARLLTVKCDTCSAELCVPDAPSWTALSLEAVRCTLHTRSPHLTPWLHPILSHSHCASHTPGGGRVCGAHGVHARERVPLAGKSSPQLSATPRRSVPHSPARPCGSQTHVFGDSSIRLKDARGDGDDTERGPRRRVVDAATAVSLDEQVEARRVGRMYVPEVDHDGF